MREPTGFVLPLSFARLKLLRDRLSIGGDFAEPVDDFRHPRGIPLVCLIGNDEHTTIYVAKGARGFRAGTGLRRLNVTDLVELAEPIKLSEFLPVIPRTIRTGLSERLRWGGLLTPRQFNALVDAAVARGGELGQLLARYSSARAERISALSASARRELAFQKEATATALAICGIDRAQLQEWDPPAQGRPSSFLDGLPQVRLREDPMVINDFTKFPGFALARTEVSGAAVFSDDVGTTLTVIIANRQPLEELTGADLLYYHEQFKSFVMVQYKAMENDGRGNATFHLPNEQLEKEIARMEKVVEALSQTEFVNDCSGFRLCTNPFFLKLCSRIVFNPDDSALVSGMYIPLDQWKLLEMSEHIRGKRGGRAITFDNVGRHLTNTTFQMLVSDAWVGTTPGQSKVLGLAIRETLSSGRAAVLAIEKRP